MAIISAILKRTDNSDIYTGKLIATKRIVDSDEFNEAIYKTPDYDEDKWIRDVAMDEYNEMEELVTFTRTKTATDVTVTIVANLNGELKTFEFYRVKTNSDEIYLISRIFNHALICWIRRYTYDLLHEEFISAISAIETAVGFIKMGSEIVSVARNLDGYRNTTEFIEELVNMKKNYDKEKSQEE